MPNTPLVFCPAFWPQPLSSSFPLSRRHLLSGYTPWSSRWYGHSLFWSHCVPWVPTSFGTQGTEFILNSVAFILQNVNPLSSAWAWHSHYLQISTFHAKQTTSFTVLPTEQSKGALPMPEPLLLLSRFSRVQLCATPWTAAHQAPPSMGSSR